ncbi:hypothetical protein BJ878DRAFT_23603 [Calycina marina]|uniref:Uncharacterized protein n=1 Tax=Calycina marina TaxID=1763456 RepID=A0A9P7Z564_9HELO|nr:hypothetical protein BJ878DRAFT_23603 [Calycina marina]
MVPPSKRKKSDSQPPPMSGTRSTKKTRMPTARDVTPSTLSTRHATNGAKTTNTVKETLEKDPKVTSPESDKDLASTIEVANVSTTIPRISTTGPDTPVDPPVSGPVDNRSKSPSLDIAIAAGYKLSQKAVQELKAPKPDANNTAQSDTNKTGQFNANKIDQSTIASSSIVRLESPDMTPPDSPVSAAKTKPDTNIDATTDVRPTATKVEVCDGSKTPILAPPNGFTAPLHLTRLIAPATMGREESVKIRNGTLALALSNPFGFGQSFQPAAVPQRSYGYPPQMPASMVLGSNTGTKQTNDFSSSQMQPSAHFSSGIGIHTRMSPSPGATTPFIQAPQNPFISNPPTHWTPLRSPQQTKPPAQPLRPRQRSQTAARRLSLENTKKAAQAYQARPLPEVAPRPPTKFMKAVEAPLESYRDSRPVTKGGGAYFHDNGKDVIDSFERANITARQTAVALQGHLRRLHVGVRLAEVDNTATNVRVILNKVKDSLESMATMGDRLVATTKEAIDQNDLMLKVLRSYQPIEQEWKRKEKAYQSELRQMHDWVPEDPSMADANAFDSGGEAEVPGNFYLSDTDSIMITNPGEADWNTARTGSAYNRKPDYKYLQGFYPKQYPVQPIPTDEEITNIVRPYVDNPKMTFKIVKRYFNDVRMKRNVQLKAIFTTRDFEKLEKHWGVARPLMEGAIIQQSPHGAYDQLRVGSQVEDTARDTSQQTTSSQASISSQQPAIQDLCLRAAAPETPTNERLINYTQKGYNIPSSSELSAAPDNLDDLLGASSPSHARPLARESSAVESANSFAHVSVIPSVVIDDDDATIDDNDADDEDYQDYGDDDVIVVEGTPKKQKQNVTGKATG